MAEASTRVCDSFHLDGSATYASTLGGYGSSCCCDVVLRATVDINVVGVGRRKKNGNQPLLLTKNNTLAAHCVCAPFFIFG